MSEVMARGPNFVFAQEFIRDKHGGETWDKVLDLLGREAQAVWRSSLLLTGSYPFSAFKAMLDSLATVAGQLAEDETSEMYEFIAERSLSTIHKFFFRFADPSFVISRYPILWQRFFQSGEVRVPEARTGSATIEFELPEIFLDWLPPACFGYSKKAIEMAGGTGLRMREVARNEVETGLWKLMYELEWTE